MLGDSNAVFDSSPPITAMLAVDALAAQSATFTGLDMLACIQTAQFVQGRHIARVDVLTDIAAEAGLARDAFIDHYRQLVGGQTDAHIEASRTLLQRTGGHGFPSFVLETQGNYVLLDIGRWLGKPEAWRDWLSHDILY